MSAAKSVDQHAPKLQLESEALEFARATDKPPFLFELPPEKGRQVVDEVQ